MVSRRKSKSIDSSENQKVMKRVTGLKYPKKNMKIVRLEKF